jgi:acyl-CoA thioester hydrolase
MHLDLHTDSAQEQQAEVERLVSLGATRVDWAYPDGARFVVLADPEGNLFCVVNTGRGKTHTAPRRISSMVMEGVFSVRVTVRGYELDTQGHLNWAEYLHYAEHARWQCLAAAGITQDGLLARGLGPVVLDVSVKFRRELRGGDDVDVTCEFVFDGGKTFGIVQEFRRADGQLAASLTSTTGLLDLRERRLADDPGKHLRALATDPSALGLG